MDPLNEMTGETLHHLYLQKLADSGLLSNDNSMRRTKGEKILHHRIIPYSLYTELIININK